MIYNNMMFHNVTELEPCSIGVKLHRLPISLQKHMEYKGPYKAQQASGCEIRFVTEAEFFNITLSLQDCESDVDVFCGDYHHSSHKLARGEVATICLEYPSELFDLVYSDELQGHMRFSPQVWRICFSVPLVVFHSIDTFGRAIRPPHPDELPKTRWLAYGSSITHGFRATKSYNPYVQVAARELGIDVYNCGLGGSCLCEKEVADFLASRNDWDIVTLEIGVNMRQRVSTEEFEKRAKYLIGEMVTKHPDKKIIVITIYPNSINFRDDCAEIKEKQERYCEILRNYVKELDAENLYLIEGSNIAKDLSYMTVDLLHPSDYGHMKMGLNLADRMKMIL